MKQAQDLSSLSYQPQLRGYTLADLFQAIQADAGIDTASKSSILQQLLSALQGMPASTPLSAVMYKVGGGILGMLISKYFGMGLMGQAVSALAGYGLGSSLNNVMNQPENPHPGFRSIA